MVDLKLLKELASDLSILYVEDDKVIGEEMARYMRKFFQRVIMAEDGLKGLDTYKKEHFDIVVSDLSMPNMSGIEMLQKIRALNENQILLVTSAHAESEYMMQAIKIGVDGYVLKPFDFEQLNHELFKIVEKINKYAQNEEYKQHLQHMVSQKTAELNSMIHFQKDNYDKTLLSMVDMIEDRDTYTAGHSQRVAKYSKMIAKAMGYSKKECEKIYQAGILHDIGKIATPDVILLKPQKLNDLEYKLIQEHVTVGYKILKNIPMFEELAEIVYSHHERYDGSGYPRGLKDKDIPPLAKVMAVADTFDAMTTNRIYKGRKTIKTALIELESLKSVSFDAKVVEAAQNVLQDIIIDVDVNQLPHSEIEKERFAYFYGDSLTNLWNQSYLDVVLVRNSFDKKYRFLHLLELKHFSQYNIENSWKNGDKVLQAIADILRSCATKAEIFRVYGDDFVLLDNESCNMSDIKSSIDKKIEELELECKLTTLDLLQHKIHQVSDLEKRCNDVSPL